MSDYFLLFQGQMPDDARVTRSCDKVCNEHDKATRIIKQGNLMQPLTSKVETFMEITTLRCTCIFDEKDDHGRETCFHTTELYYIFAYTFGQMVYRLHALARGSFSTLNIR